MARGLLFAPDTVAEEELAEDAWEPAALLLDDHDGEEKEFGPQETPGSAGRHPAIRNRTGFQQAQQVLGPASQSGYWPCGLCTDGDRRRRIERWRAPRSE